ncbi:MAG: histidine phosphatase family protein [Bacteroidota bacterium]
MKRLYLVRHAKSSWDFPELTDHDRPLNKRGKRDAPEMGRRLTEKHILPDLMVSSTALRAMTTCQVIAESIGYPEARIIGDRNVFHAGSGTLLQVVRNTTEKADSLMLFGHNPGFTDFANRLARTNIWNIPTCGVFACTFSVDSWSEIEFGKGMMTFYDYPKKSTEGTI